MPISCSCPDIDYDGDGWWYYSPTDYASFPMKNRKRCCSCKSHIANGDLSTEFPRYRRPVTDIDESISGEEVALASWWMCETCSDLFFSITEMGYCVMIGGNMKDEAQEASAIAARVRSVRQSIYKTSNGEGDL